MALSVLDKDLLIPPVAPADGDAYLLYGAPAAGNAWTGHQGEIATWWRRGQIWRFYAPMPGWDVFCIDDDTLWVQKSTASPWTWMQIGGGGASANAYDYRDEEFLQGGFHLGSDGGPVNVALTAWGGVAMPYPVKVACKLKKLKIRAVDVGGWDVKLAFWANKVGDIYPGALLAHGEITNVIATGLKEIVITPAIDLAVGMYWIGYRCASFPRVYGPSSPQEIILGYSNGDALQTIWGRSNTEAYATFPADPFSLVGKGKVSGYMPHILAEIEY